MAVEEVAMSSPDERITLTDDQRRRRRSRSIAIAVILAGLVVLFYVITMVKLASTAVDPSL